MNKERAEQGFTIIELIVAFVVLVVLAVFFFLQRNELETANRDQTRKATINSMYYALTEGYYKEHGYYPQNISRDNLKTVDPSIFTDPDGYTLHGNQCTYTNLNNKQATDGNCNYKYSASKCDNKGKCQAFKLTADLEAESDYTKEVKVKSK